MRYALLGKPFEFFLELLLVSKQNADVVLQQVEPALNVHPASENQGSEENKLKNNRKIYLPIEPPALRIRIFLRHSYTGA